VTRLAEIRPLPPHEDDAAAAADARKPGSWESLRADFRANAPGLADDADAAAVLRAALRNVPTVRFLSVALLRLAQALGARAGIAGSLVKQLNHVLTGCDIAYQAEIGPGLVLYHPTGVVVGPGCRIGRRARLMQGTTIGSNAVIAENGAVGSPVLGDDVFVGPGAVVVGPVSLGDRVQVGANAVVTSSFGSDVVVAGAPARVIRPT
jgi:serine O-acetyltransferase